VLFIFSFLINLIWIFQVVDVKDSGIHIADQMLSVPMTNNQIMPLSVLTRPKKSLPVFRLILT
jgi:hypothetical protein